MGEAVRPVNVACSDGRSRAALGVPGSDAGGNLARRGNLGVGRRFSARQVLCGEASRPTDAGWPQVCGRPNGCLCAGMDVDAG